jgi:hypothetical protein
MAKVKTKSKKEVTCKALSDLQISELAELIIRAAGASDISRGINSRKRRRLPPPGSVMIF